jgi:hypothetical protein
MLYVPAGFSRPAPGRASGVGVWLVGVPALRATAADRGRDVGRHPPLIRSGAHCIAALISSKITHLILLSRIRKDPVPCFVLAMCAPLTCILSDRSRPPAACRRGSRREHRRARRLGHVPRRSKATEAQGRLADGTVGVGTIQQLQGRGGGVATVTSGSCRRCCKCSAMIRTVLRPPALPSLCRRGYKDCLFGRRLIGLSFCVKCVCVYGIFFKSCLSQGC